MLVQSNITTSKASPQLACSARLPSTRPSVATTCRTNARYSSAATRPLPDLRGSHGGHHRRRSTTCTAGASDVATTVDPNNCAILLVQCTDQRGVVAALSQLLYGFGCNILTIDQFVCSSKSVFFQRVEFDFTQMVVGPGNAIILERAVAELATRFSMQWSMSYRGKRKRLAILVSKLDHCLYDLLIRHKSGELDCDIPVIISNHPDLRHIGEMFGVEFRVLSAGPGRLAPAGAAGGKHEATGENGHAAKPDGTKMAQEAEIEAIIKEMGIDMIVLARYMQIMSREFCERHWEHTINIHHSFLPAFEGAKPYHRAYERGVKVIGATAHYATADLDAGPIIDQQVVRITHKDQVEDMVRRGRDLERLVLAQAVRWHVEDRVLVRNNKTIVFND